MCRSVKSGGRGGAERQSKAGIAGESLCEAVVALRGTGCSCCFTGAFPSRIPQPCPAFWPKSAGSQFSLVHSPLRVFEATLEEVTQPALWVLAAPAFPCAPRGLPAASPSRSVSPPSPGCQGSSLPLSRRGAKAFVFKTTVNQGRLLPSRLCGPLLQYAAGPHAWGEAIAGCDGACPSISAGSETPLSSPSNILGYFQVKDQIPRSSVLRGLFKIVFFLPISTGNSYL